MEDGVLYEGTGLYGQSRLRRVDILTGKILQEHRLMKSLFGEGITVFENRVIQLTWKSRIGLIYDKNSLKPIGTFRYQGEGWGITHDGSSLIMSDGTEMLRFLDPNTFKEIKRLKVMSLHGPVQLLNELEYVEGSIYANIWQSDRIAIIDPQTGFVEGWVDLSGILPMERKNENDVLNGIAFDQRNKSLYVTGKRWPQIFQIELVPQQSNIQRP